MNDRFGEEENTNTESETEGRETVVETVKEKEVSTQEVEQLSVLTNMYRYQCPACTGNAYYSNGIPDRHMAEVCHNCGAVLGDMNFNNFIELTANEVEQLRALE